MKRIAFSELNKMAICDKYLFINRHSQLQLIGVIMERIEEFNQWKSTQDVREKSSGWWHKYTRKELNAIKDSIVFSLTFDEYLYLAFIANINSPEEITVGGMQLGRYEDKGGYTSNPFNCRFISHADNMTDMFAHKDWSLIQGENHSCATISNEQARSIKIDPRSFESIANEHNCSTRIVFQIKKEYTWKSITADLKVVWPEDYIPTTRGIEPEVVSSIFLDERTQYKDIADDYNVSVQTVSRIKHKRAYTNITQNL